MNEFIFFTSVFTKEGGGQILEMHTDFSREKEEMQKKSESGQNRRAGGERQKPNKP